MMGRPEDLSRETGPRGKEVPPGPQCRFCGADLRHTVVDLGMSPPCESYLRPSELNAAERFYPLHVRLCTRCYLVQLEEYLAPGEIFTEYAYFSSYSDSWLAHARSYAGQLERQLSLGPDSLVIELGSNDGYLLQFFVERGIPVLGIEPAANVAAAAQARGVPTLVRFFGTEVARELAGAGRRPDLLVGNNVLAQVPDLNDFVEGLRVLLGPRGVITMEFPHLMQLIQGNQFDTIYHEHFSYFSFGTAEKIFAAHGLTLFDVEELPTHGGSLRIYARHEGDATRAVSERVGNLRAKEAAAGLTTLEYYATFEERVKETKRKLLEFLIRARRAGQSVAGYGAPGKGNTLLNYCGIRTDFIDFTVDRSPYKQGLFLPGTHIPVYHPDEIQRRRPAYVLVLPWNLKEEIMQQLAYIRSWGGQFVLPIPELTVLP